MSLLLLGVMVVAMAPDARPITYGDLERHTAAIVKQLTELVTAFAGLTKEVAEANVNLARHDERLDQHTDHVMAIQKKIDHAGIDGKRTLPDMSTVVTWANLRMVIGFIVLALAGMGYLFANFALKVK